MQLTGLSDYISPISLDVTVANEHINFPSDITYPGLLNGDFDLVPTRYIADGVSVCIVSLRLAGTEWTQQLPDLPKVQGNWAYDCPLTLLSDFGQKIPEANSPQCCISRIIWIKSSVSLI
jgi:hypothetical protein